MSMNYKIGTYTQQTWGSHDPIFGKIGQRSRSQWHIMYVDKICLNSVPGGPINFILGADITTIPTTSGAPNGCHGNTGCLATRPRNMHYMIEYVKNAKAYKLQNRHISSRCGPGHMTQFL